MTTAIKKYEPTEAALTDLESRYKGIVFDVTTPKGMQEAQASYKDINTYSITLEKARVAEKAESLAYGRLVDSEAKRIADKLDALRLPIKEMIETETKRVEREAAAAIKAEQDRIIAEQAAIKAAEEKRMANERAELNRRQAEMAAAEKAARDKIEAEERAARLKIEEAERAARIAREEADRIARQAREAEEAKAKAIRDEEEKRLKAERDRIDAEARVVAEAQRKAQAEADAKARAEREAEEAKEREIRRAAERLQGAEAMLIRFQELYRTMPQFAEISKAISIYLVAHGLEDAA